MREVWKVEGLCRGIQGGDMREARRVMGIVACFFGMVYAYEADAVLATRPEKEHILPSCCLRARASTLPPIAAP